MYNNKYTYVISITYTEHILQDNRHFFEQFRIFKLRQTLHINLQIKYTCVVNNKYTCVINITYIDHILQDKR